jgi:hypothetical protein
VAEHADDLDLAAQQLAHGRVAEAPVPGLGAGLDAKPVQVLARPACAQSRHRLGRDVHALRVEEARGQVGVDAERRAVERGDGAGVCGIDGLRRLARDGGQARDPGGDDAEDDQELGGAAAHVGYWHLKEIAASDATRSRSLP